MGGTRGATRFASAAALCCVELTRWTAARAAPPVTIAKASHTHTVSECMLHYSWPVCVCVCVLASGHIMRVAAAAAKVTAEV